MKPGLQKMVLGTSAIALVAVMLALGFRSGSSGATGAKTKSAEQASWIEKGWNATLNAIHSVQTKADELRQSHEEVARLRNENAHLRIALELAHNEIRERQAAADHKKAVAKAKKEAGTASGRIDRTIGYQPPEHLTPEQMFTLGLSYFKGREDEKAAKIFTLLSKLDESEPGQTQRQTDSYILARNHMLAGISWYRIDNLKTASEHFKKARELDRQGVGDQVRLWNALIAQRQGDRRQAQEYLKQVLDRNPHSMEAKWINPGAGSRKLAGKTQAEKNQAGKNHGGKRALASDGQ